jgi:hypothetical protein
LESSRIFAPALYPLLSNLVNKKIIFRAIVLFTLKGIFDAPFTNSIFHQNQKKLHMKKTFHDCLCWFALMGINAFRTKHNNLREQRRLKANLGLAKAIINGFLPSALKIAILFANLCVDDTLVIYSNCCRWLRCRTEWIWVISLKRISFYLSRCQ